MTAERRELSPVQVLEIADALGLSTPGEDRVWVLAIDPQMGRGTADVLAPDDVVWFMGSEMFLGSMARHTNTGTVQATFKKRRKRKTT